MLFSVFDHLDYRKAIRSWISNRPSKGRGEMKVIAEKLGIQTSVFSQTMGGMRELSEDHAYLIADHIGLTELEKEYFIALVQFERASHHSYKEHLKKKLVMIKNQSKVLFKRLEQETMLSEKSQAEFYSSWLYSAIRLRTSLDGGVNLEQICTEFHLTRDHGNKLLGFLTSSGLVEKNEEMYTIGPARTHVGADSPFVSRHHANWRIRAIERSHNLKQDELMFSGPLTVSQEDFDILREKMVILIQEVSDRVKNSPAEVLACFNIDFFKVK